MVEFREPDFAFAISSPYFISVCFKLKDQFIGSCVAESRFQVGIENLCSWR